MTARGVLLVLVIVFPLSELALLSMRRSRTRILLHADDSSTGILWLVIAGSLAAAIGAQWLPMAHGLGPTAVTRPIAVAALVLGLALRWVSVYTLGRFFTVDVAIHEDHALVERGVYRHLRHPSYAGLLLAFLGLGLWFESWLSLAVLLLPITGAILLRIRKEEAVLLRALGPGYGAYCAKTRRLVPGVF